MQSDLGWRVRQQQAAEDVGAGLRLWRLALTLGWFDIRLRYRGSVLGPLWLTLSTAVMVAALGLLYSKLFKMELHDYLPFLSVSLVLWNTLGTVVSEACTCFLAADGMIKAMRMPFALYVSRVLVRNLLVFAHNVVVILAVYAYFDVWPGWAVLEAVPGLLIWVIDGFSVCLLLGVLCARFRDIPPIVASLMQIAFFISPVIWKPELLAAGQRWLPFNPFYTLLEIVRGPLLGQDVGLIVWASALAFSLVLAVLGWVAFVRVRGRLAFWV